MAEIRPFRAIRPQKGYADRIAALPYDVFSLQEARAEVEREPLSFLAIDRPETIAGEGEDIYRKAGDRLKEQIAEGFYLQDELPAFYVYELTAGARSQTGIGALTRVDDYLEGAICRHENTRADKEADRVCHVQACRAQTGPIFMAYRAQEGIRGLIQDVKDSEEPVYDIETPDRVRHRIWAVYEPEQLEELCEAFESVSRFYIADGHHRCAAAVSYALQRRKQKPDYDGEEPWNFILSVLFPDDELKIMDYNRVVKDLNGLTRKQLLHQIGSHFEVEFLGKTAVAPRQKGMFGMYLQDGWYELYIRSEEQSSDPVEGLDVSLLQRCLLAPVLGILSPRTDKRISFVGGIRGLSELERAVNQTGGAAFSMFPTSIGELFAVADAGQLMPPKSTWFEPKLRSGLLIYGLEEA